MNVREIERSDVSDIFTLIQAKVEFDGYPESLKLDESEIENIFFSEAPKAKAIVALIDGKPHWYSYVLRHIFNLHRKTAGLWLDDLYVYEAYRKTRAGKALITKLCNIAKESGCTRIDWIVARNNGNRKGFYHSIGASISEEVRQSRLDEKAINQLAES